MADTLVVNEIFFSIQGEGLRAGRPCTFVRLTGCHLRCRYCDTEYAFHEGRRRPIDDILAEVHALSGDDPGRLVEITGGEPLLQPAVHELMRRLCDAGRTVLLETSGACDISTCDERVIRIMDLKCPDSGEADRNCWANVDHLTERDEVKFVLCSRRDYDWACEVVNRHQLERRCGAVFFCPAAATPPGDELPGTGGLSLRTLAEWILEDRLPVRIQSQLHKLIWDAAMRGV